ncbi:lymphocyte activation gene 3 protein isoform X1 [Choloepus didactylus]|uniref:lymphocyte activation gene 3 protein isoform X1 n=1 Tax=Choloepus didactylus TaxID=27675 RepID=UPI00189CC357|nr:lymphocyte activation gene 3 protein isoform X1 [Choloepus didactylus]
MGEAQFLVLLLLQLLWVAPEEATGSGTEVPVVWAQEGAPVQLPCSPRIPLGDPDLLRRGAVVSWQHQPDSGPPGLALGRPPALGPGPARPSPGGRERRRYTVLSVALGGLRSGRQPLQPRVQLAEPGLRRGDFSLWLRPARRADAGEYSAAVRLRDRSLSCRLRLSVGRASMTASPPGPLRTSQWVVLNCSFSRPDLPVSVRWFRGRVPVPVPESPLHHASGSVLFLPHISPSDSGPWGCILTYRDGFNVSITYNLIVLGLEPSAPLTVYAGAGSRVELPCSLPPGLGAQSLLTAKWTPPGGGPDLLVAGNKGNFTLLLEAVSQAQAGPYTCHVLLQGHQLSATITLAVITVTPKSFGLPCSQGKLLCEVTPASGQERFVWRSLGNQSWRSPPGPWLQTQEATFLSQPWQCQLYQGERLLGAAVYSTELSGLGAQHSGGAPGALTAGHLSLFLILGILLFLLVAGAFGFHFWRRRWQPRRFSALEHGIHPPQAQGKMEMLEKELEQAPGEEPEPEPQLELEPQLEPELEPQLELEQEPEQL